VAGLPAETPLPATSALLAFGFYQIYNHNPVGYLGYLYFLEFTPTSSGSAFMDALERVGVPRAAMSFLRDHTTVDVGHNLMMEQYVETLVRGRRELDAVVYAMQTTGYLYAQMLNAAIADAEAPAGRQARHEEARGSAYFDDDLVPVGVPART
jgi:pyrroloquinoline quinone (PQQ) biosynthesis protein C